MDSEEKSIKYAYIVFKSTENTQRAIQAYDVSSGFRVWSHICKCCISKENKHKMERNIFYDRWLDVQLAGLPEEIKWENLGYSKSNRKCRKLFIMFLTKLLMVAGIFAVVYMKYASDSLKDEF